MGTARESPAAAKLTEDSPSLTLGRVPNAVLVVDLPYFQARVLQDALTQAMADYWLSRAEVWEAARPKAGDYQGSATPEQLRAADARCVMVAENCRRHAALLRSQLPEEISDEVATVLDEVRSALAKVA
jgi:hypothetical protein